MSEQAPFQPPPHSNQELIEAFKSSRKFPLDPFQEQACEVLARGNSVLVAAPTGAGKTVVAEFAVFLATQDRRKKIFYTAPMKALSNQKYQEFLAEYGQHRVGLLTGDSNINPEAQIVVMTTEVLRNMIYAGSDLLPDLAWVVLDEVHFLGDRFRGAVWEEIIIHLPAQVRLVSLSATVSNAEEFGAWLQTVRGDTEVIVSETRPVPLQQHVLIKNQLAPLFEPNSKTVSAELNDLSRFSSRNGRVSNRQKQQRGQRNFPHQRTSRTAVIRLLAENDLLPAIYFIFSRVGCDAAVSQVLREQLWLTTPAERKEINSILDATITDLPEEDLQILGYWHWREALERGVAAHHAGLLPIFKEAVELLFQKKLLKVVFATETLSLGINMPARTTVLEKLQKFNGEQRVPITSGEYTQLTGRAGRRGIDTEGHSVVLWEDGMVPDFVASLASRRSYPLYSSFKPSYNMTVNLLDQFGRQRSEEILESSFAQFQADRSVVEMARTVHSQEDSLNKYLEAMECDLGDFREYSALRRELSDLEKMRTPNPSKAELATRQKKLNKTRNRLKAHPCHSCPDREAHARWGERYQQLKRKSDNLKQQIRTKTGALVKTFARIIDSLLELEYLEEHEGDLVLTDRGAVLKHIYSERDLLVAECLRHGIWEGLDAPGLAAIMSCIVYEPRGEASYSPRLPKQGFSEVYEQTVQLWHELEQLAQFHRLPTTDTPSAEFALPSNRWAKGHSLDQILYDAELSAGDFVRWMKQLIDLLDQISKIVSTEHKAKYTAARDSVFRGIVAYSSL